MAAINNARASFFVSPSGEILSRSKAISPVLRLAIYERDGGVCQLCGSPVRRFGRFRGDPMTGEVDHIVPLSRGGLSSESNLRLLCVPCNRSKSNG